MAMNICLFLKHFPSKSFHPVSHPTAEVLDLQFQVQTLLKVAKTNFVVMKLLLGGHKKDSQVNKKDGNSTV